VLRLGFLVFFVGSRASEAHRAWLMRAALSLSDGILFDLLETVVENSHGFILLLGPLRLPAVGRMNIFRGVLVDRSGVSSLRLRRMPRLFVCICRLADNWSLAHATLV